MSRSELTTAFTALAVRLCCFNAATKWGAVSGRIGQQVAQRFGLGVQFVEPTVGVAIRGTPRRRPLVRVLAIGFEKPA